jgi:hypothetical protein
MAKTQTDFHMTLRVLGYREDGGWAAHCLETDLVGRGKTFALACKALQELTEMQISFAVYKDQRSLLDHPAPPNIWQTFERVTQEHLRSVQKPKALRTNALAGLPLQTRSEDSDRLAWCGA